MKKLIIASLTSLAAIAALSFTFVAVSGNVRDYRSSLETSVSQIASGEKDFNRMTKILDIMKSRDPDIQRILHIAIDRQRPLAFIETIEKIGHLTHVKIALTVDEKNDAQGLVFRAALEGSGPDVRTMLALIQQLPYQIRIEDVSFQRDIPANSESDKRISSSNTRLFLVMRIKTQQ